MLPTMFLSSPRSRRNSTRMPDSSVATRDSYGAEVMKMSLIPFCPLSLQAHLEFAGGAKGLPRLILPLRGDLLRHPVGQDREDGVAAGQVEIGDSRRPRRHLPGLPDGNPAGEEGREFFPDFGRRNGETGLRLHEFREALRADGEGMRKGKTGGGVEPLAVGNGETGPPQGAPPEGLEPQPAQIPWRAFLGVPYAHDVTKNPVAAGFRVRRLRAGFPLLLPTRTGGVRGVGP